MLSCIYKFLERFGIIDHVEDIKWNAHGDTATTSAADVPLKIDSASFWIDGAGEYPTDAEHVSGFEEKLLWIGNKYAFRAGAVSNTAWDEVNIGTGSIAMGNNALADDLNTIAIGSGTEATAVGALSLGSANQASGFFSNCIGNNNISSGTSNLSFGAFCQASGSANSYVFGSGVSGGAGLLTNSKANSMVIGFGSTTGTFFLEDGKCGIVEDTPLSTLDVGGSVGYKYTNITANNDTTILTATDNEYTFRVDIGSSKSHTVVLPELSTVDRRIYYFKTTNISGGGSTGSLTLQAHANDKIDAGLGTVSATGGTIVDGVPGHAYLLFGNGSDQVWWVQ